MPKVKKQCSNCYWRKTCSFSSKGKPCSNWVYHKARCELCLFYDDCLALNKPLKVCYNFRKAKGKKLQKGLLHSDINKEIDIYKGDLENEDDLNIASLVDRIIKNNYDARVLDLIQLKDLNFPSNIVEFIISPSFLNVSLFPRQLQFALELFGAYCPFCSDTDFIRNKIEVNTPIDEILDRTVLYDKGRCPKCKKSRYYAIKKDLHNFYHTFIGVAGQRSSKSSMVVIFSAAILNYYLSLPSPVDFFGLLPNSTLHATFVGLRFTDAFENLWYPLYNLIVYSEWYENFHKLLDEQAYKLGVELYKIRDSFISYNFKRIALYPSGPDKRKLRGRCLPSYSLVNTSHGLLRVDELKNHLPIYTFLGKEIRPIIAIKSQGKKHIVRVTLENGLYFDLSFDHKVPCIDSLPDEFNPIDFRFERAKDLEGKFVVLQRYSQVVEETVKFPSNDYYKLLAFLFVFPIRKIGNQVIVGIGNSKTKISDLITILRKVFNSGIFIKVDKGLLLIESKKIIDFVDKYVGIDRNFEPIRRLTNNQICNLITEIFNLTINSSDYQIIDNFNCYLPIANVSYTQNKEKINLLMKLMLNVGLTPFLINPNKEQYIALDISEVDRFKKIYKGNRKIDIVCPYKYKIQGDINFRIIRFNGCSMLSDNSLVLMKVASVKLRNLEEVYDIQVLADDELFSVDGVVVHNTRIIASIDELSWFTGSDSIKYDPDEIYRALDNSLVTVRTASKKLLKKIPDIIPAYGLYISSPVSKTDKLMRLYNQSKTVKYFYGFKYPTWEVNPNISKEDLADKFATDPIGAQRDFGADPPYSDQPYISSPSTLVNVFTKKKNLIILEGIEYTRDSLGGKLLYPTIRLRKKITHPCILAIDCGYNNNSFACCIVYMNRDEITCVPGLLEIRPKPYPISFPDVYDNVIAYLCEELDIRYVVADRWQSINLTQSVYRDFEIDSFTYSVTKDDFKLLKELIYSNEIEFPITELPFDQLISLEQDVEKLVVNKPCSYLFLQFLLSRDINGMVQKGFGVSDDILRAVTLGVAILHDEEYQNYLINNKDDDLKGINSYIAVKPLRTQEAISNFLVGKFSAPTSKSSMGVVRGFGMPNLV